MTHRSVIVEVVMRLVLSRVTTLGRYDLKSRTGLPTSIKSDFLGFTSNFLKENQLIRGERQSDNGSRPKLELS